MTALARGDTVKHAAESIHVPRQQMYVYRTADATLAAAWDAALDEGTEALEQEAKRRAVDGTDKPVYQQGMVVGHIREYSDTLLIFLLKARKPLTYRERVDVQHSGTVKHEHYDLTKLSDPELVQLEQVLASATADPRRN